MSQSPLSASALLACLMAALTACGGATVTSSPPVATIPATTLPSMPPVGTAPPAAATVSPTAASAAYDCSGLPTADPDGLVPDLTTDPVLEAQVPEMIDGQPVTNLRSMLLVENRCVEAGQTSADSLLNAMPDMFDSATLSIATARVTVEGEAVGLVAFRAPGTDAAAAADEFVLLLAAIGADIEQFVQSIAVIGGKRVLVFTDETDPSLTTYIYAAGDTFVGAGGIADSQAELIFSAWP